MKRIVFLISFVVMSLFSVNFNCYSEAELDGIKFKNLSPFSEKVKNNYYKLDKEKKLVFLIFMSREDYAKPYWLLLQNVINDPRMTKDDKNDLVNDIFYTFCDGLVKRTDIAPTFKKGYNLSREFSWKHAAGLINLAMNGKVVDNGKWISQVSTYDMEVIYPFLLKYMNEVVSVCSGIDGECTRGELEKVKKMEYNSTRAINGYFNAMLMYVMDNLAVTLEVMIDFHRSGKIYYDEYAALYTPECQEKWWNRYYEHRRKYSE